ncbi:MAG: glucuronate isomerase [Clostridiales bacterium]|nr:glucuronate isomerase [Clostridiales bacterium]
MKPFMDKDFLLDTDMARHLYHDYAEKMPIVDYHCHLSPREIYEDRSYENITQVWLGGDHYKWRQMRSNGVEERFITGDAPDREKFQMWAQTLEMAIGNPLYHWSHLELQRYFGYNEYLCGDTAREVWDLCNEKLARPDMSARNLIRRSNVTVICTTDDPVDSLEWHKKLAQDESFEVQVLPAWRPDRAMYIEKPDYPDYILQLEAVSGIKIDFFADLIQALCRRMDFFDSMGCRVSDHGLAYVPFAPASGEEVDEIFRRRLAGGTVSAQDRARFTTAFMTEVGKEYSRRGWVMQLHYGVKRDNDRRRFELLGPDTGFDSIASPAPISELADFLDHLARTVQLPRTILYSLNPGDNAAIGTLIGCFQDDTCAGKVQQGSAWWFNDHKTGMMEQMTSLANLGLLGNFVGMLTDSRSFLSYTRHEYFRRNLCNLAGGWVENGEYPKDEKALKKIVEGICYNNAMRYFGFERPE